MTNELTSLDEELERAVAGLDAAQTQATPKERPNAWNIQQIIEHELLTFTTATAAIEARIQKGAPTQARPGLKGTFAHWWILTMGRFPHGRMAPDVVMPTRPLTLESGAQLASRVREELRRVGSALDQAEALFGKSGRVSHMKLGPLTIEQWRRFHLVHGRHHIRQIQTIRRQHGFGT